jgi:hypothetical protein
VSVTFENGYTFERFRRFASRGGSGASVSRRGEVVDPPAADARVRQQRALETLGVDKDAFSRAGENPTPARY